MRKICEAAHPNLVGTLNVEGIEINDGDEGASGVETGFTIATIPAGSILKSVYTHNVQAFNSGSSDLLTVGKTGSTSAYQDSGDITEGTPGWYTDVVSGSLPALISTETEVKLYLTSTGTAPTAGKVRGFVEWVRLSL